MRFPRTFLPMVCLVLFTCILASCGSTSTSTTSSYGGSNVASTATTSTSATTPTTAAGKSYSTPTTSTGNTNIASIKTATATVNSKTETILTNAKGMTLYYFTADTKTTAACTGGCTSAWPPFVVTGANTVTSTTTLPGKLTTLADANGTQVQYNGHFLYTFASDTAPGQTNGEGVGGKWFVATPSLL